MNTIELDTSTLPPSERVERWQQALNDTFGPIQVRPMGGQAPVVASLRSLRRGPLAFHAMRYRGMNLSRQPKHVAHLSEEFITLTLPQTTMRVTHFHVERTLSAGGVYLFNHAVAYQTQVDEEYRTESIAFPLALLRDRVGDLQPFYDLHNCCEHAASLDMMRAFASHLSLGARQWSDHEYACWSEQLLQMLGLLLAHTPADAAALKSHALTHHRQRALRHIRSHAADPDLSPRSVAQACGLSLGYLHEAFKGTHCSLEEAIFDARLELARRWLIDPLRRHLPIRTVCYDAGFNDPAHFSRRFKSRFGMTPGDWRKSPLDS